MNKDMKILVTGVKGQLGYDVCKELEKRGYTNYLGIDKEDLDITDEKAVYEYVKNYNPDVIMHNAAWTAVDKAEENYDACYAVNVLGTKYLSEAAKKVDAKIVYISTDYVFDGNGTNFFEVEDKKEPLSVYGKTKYEGELEVLKNPKHFIVRISWVFGINGNNFVKTMLKLAQTRNELNVVSDQIGSPTYTRDLSVLLCDMIETEKYGTYHATNEGVCSWYDFTKKIYEVAGITHMSVNPVTTKEYQSMVKQAHRPLNSRMSKSSLDKAGFKRLPTWEEALSKYISELKQETENKDMKTSMVKR